MSTTSADASHDVVFLLFDEMDLLDFGGPYEVLLTANRLSERSGQAAPFRLHTVSPDDQPVTAYGGIGLTPADTITSIDGPDVVVIPGSIDPNGIATNPEISSAITSITAESTIITSVCTGSYVLGQLGLLDGRDWTTHWEDIPELQNKLALRNTDSETTIGRSERIVDSGNVITAGALTCGLDLGLHLVARLVNPTLAHKTAQQIDFPWSQDTAALTGRATETEQG